MKQPAQHYPREQKFSPADMKQPAQHYLQKFDTPNDQDEIGSIPSDSSSPKNAAQPKLDQ